MGKCPISEISQLGISKLTLQFIFMGLRAQSINHCIYTCRTSPFLNLYTWAWIICALLLIYTWQDNETMVKGSFTLYYLS